ncbi:MAG TPA: RecQ family ATP-dependent DNA helicase [Roseiflexaceae bacterium]|nr:RecQ family ATP-dependent DNA helicase [Roseiflexaceae bacterium]
MDDPLISLPPHLLAGITGERRKRLVEYLVRWGESPAALACLDVWLEAQPHLATLREARARVLVEEGRADEALELLDALDGERGLTETRRQLRVRALAAGGRWGEAHALLPARQDDPSVWRQRADLLRQQGRYDEAAAAYARFEELLPEGSAPLRGLAELALAKGDAVQARALLLARQQRAEGAPLDTRDLQLLHEALVMQDLAAAAAEVDGQLAERRKAEQAALAVELGLSEEVLADEAHAEHEAAAHQEAAPVPDSRSRTALPGRAPDAAALAASVPAASLPTEAHELLREHFGYQDFRAGQSEVIARVLAGESVLAVLPTGAGKSLTYQLPALLSPGVTLVISPLIALMKDQIDNLPPGLADQATSLHSALDSSTLAARLRGVAAGRYRLVYVAPERLRQRPFVHALRRGGVARVAVDEAHCVSLWGISFRPDYLFIRRAIDALGAPPVLALTATATPDTETEIKEQLGDLATVRASVFRRNLRFEVCRVSNRTEKDAAVVELCRQTDGPVVVYVRSREGCEQLAALLRQRGVAAEYYHAQVGDRAGVQDRFMRGATRVLVATVAFGMGVDKPDIRMIIHYNLPQSVEAYYQEAGRAGRDGLDSRCVLLYAPADKGQLTSWLREEALTRDELRRVYAALKRLARGDWVLAPTEALAQELGADETRVRVALGVLERVGLLVRHFDLPHSATLHPAGLDGDAHFRQFARAARLDSGLPVPADLLDLAQRSGRAPAELEAELLAWQDAGLLRYDGAAREMLLELRKPPPDTPARIDALLAEYADAQDARVEAIAAYARGLGCRHRAIAAHFGERMPTCRSACDVCAPAAGAPAAQGRASGREQRHSGDAAGPALPPAGVQAAILDAVRELPGQLGEKELVCTLLGLPGYPDCESFGRLAGADLARTRQAVQALVAARKLAYRNRMLVPIGGPLAPDAPADPRAAVLGCLARLPFPVGRSGLAKILKGASGSPIGPERCADFGVLNHMTGAVIEAAIEQLIAQGYLVRRENGVRPLLALTDIGMAELGVQ